MAGRNLAELNIKMYESASSSDSKPCIFISHISIDKEAAEEICEYIRYHGNVDVYFDKNDEELQWAVQMDNAELITKMIEKGINRSSHVMCLVSDDTVRSWWVPYEIGFGKKGNKKISTLILKDTDELPEYLEISTILKGTKSLNQYLRKMHGTLRTSIATESLSYDDVIHGEDTISHSDQDHPLDEYLDWNS
ncbi:MAG: toll/interleukin-1 receptor domain-containing protein [Pseudomonadota bacterium]